MWPPNCLDTCEGATFVPICSSCSSSSLEGESEETCRACQECRIEEEAEFYSLRDAACMSDAQYGLLASVSFTIMFAASGLVAGHLTDRLDARKLHAGAVRGREPGDSTWVVSKRRGARRAWGALGSPRAMIARRRKKEPKKTTGTRPREEGARRKVATRLVAGAVLVWSLSSFAKVVSPNFKLLVCMRLVMGVAQGFNAPCAYPVIARAGKGCEIPNFKGSYLGRFPLVSADFWTSDHPSERSRT